VREIDEILFPEKLRAVRFGLELISKLVNWQFQQLSICKAGLFDISIVPKLLSAQRRSTKAVFALRSRVVKLFDAQIKEPVNNFV
jgi:hypothetical protein